MTIRPLLPSILRSSSPFSQCLFSRPISLNSAINRGLRRSPGGRRRPGRPSPSSSRLDPPPARDPNQSPTAFSPRLGSPPVRDPNQSRFSPPLDTPPEPNHPPNTLFDPTDFSSYDPEDINHSPTRYPPESKEPTFCSYYAWHPFARPNPRLDYPAPPPSADWTPKLRRHILKTDFNSEWIYGTSAVEAALKVRTRTLYKLHILVSANRSPDNKIRDRLMCILAADAGVEVVEETDSGLLDSMSNSRPHNGYVLECLPLPRTPILSLGPVAANKTSFSVQLAQHHHTTGEIVNEDQFAQTIPCRDPRRYPFVLMLDEILDPGNLGAILRSAYYLGADAIALSSRNCAPLSPVCLKAAAGAAELLPILEQARSDKLIANSADSGWMFYAGVPPPSRNKARRDRYVLASEVGNALANGPVVLLLGGEGDGVRPFLRKHVDHCVSLDKGPGTDSLVDSLNVSVAAALLCSSFLRQV